MQREDIKVFAVIDTDRIRLLETQEILQVYGKAYDAYRPADLKTILEQEQRIDAVFVSTKIQNLRDNITNILKIIKEETLVYVVGEINPDLLGELFRLGVTDSLPHPLNPSEVGFHQQERAVSLKGEGREIQVDFGASQLTRERIVVVCTPKGGSGGSVFAVQLGAAMAKLSGGTVLIDADYAGNAARIAGKESVNSIAEFDDDRTQTLDRETLEQKLVVHPESGLKILASPLDVITSIPQRMLRNAIVAYRQYYSLMVIDLHTGYTPNLEMAKDYATDIVIVVDGDLRQMERIYKFFSRLQSQNVDPSKLRVIVNKTKSIETAQMVRYALKKAHLENVPISHLPYTSDFEQDKLPMYQDPKKSAYSKALREILSEMVDRKKSEQKNSSSQAESRTSSPGKRWLKFFTFGGFYK